MDARDGLLAARRAITEGQRRLEQRLAEAELGLGEPVSPPPPLGPAVAPCAPEAVLGLAEPGRDSALPPSRWRAAFLTAWAALFVALGTGFASRWDVLVTTLAAVPEPTMAAAPPVAAVPFVTVGERAVARAQALADDGRAREALEVLRQVRPEEPAYPYAQRLHAELARHTAEPHPSVPDSHR